MPAVTVRNLDPQTHRALKARAARHGRSTEAEIRAILDQSVADSPAPGLGTVLFEIGRSAALTDEEFALFESVRDRTPVQPMSFE
jgi:plasmid stability protein